MIGGLRSSTSTVIHLRDFDVKYPESVPNLLHRHGFHDGRELGAVPFNVPHRNGVTDRRRPLVSLRLDVTKIRFARFAKCDLPDRPETFVTFHVPKPSKQPGLRVGETCRLVN